MTKVLALQWPVCCAGHSLQFLQNKTKLIRSMYTIVSSSLKQAFTTDNKKTWSASLSLSLHLFVGDVEFEGGIPWMDTVNCELRNSWCRQHIKCLEGWPRQPSTLILVLICKRASPSLFPSPTPLFSQLFYILICKRTKPIFPPSPHPTFFQLFYILICKWTEPKMHTNMVCACVGEYMWAHAYVSYHTYTTQTLCWYAVSVADNTQTPTPPTLYMQKQCTYLAVK